MSITPLERLEQTPTGLIVMYLGKRTPVDADAFSLTWAPKLIGFFQLFIGDQAIAEELTIETLVEETRAPLAFGERTFPLRMLRRALKKAERASVPTTMSTDAIVRTVTALPQSQRAVVALFHGASLELNAVANVMRCDVGEVKRLCAEALLTLHHSLQEFRHDARTENSAGELK